MKIVQRRIWILSALIGGAMCFIAAPIAVLLTWGQRQAITVSRVEKTVRRGMSLNEIAFALGQPPGALDSLTRAFFSSRNPAPTYVLTVSRSGVGSLIVPQHNIVLYLDKNRQVFAGIDKVVYQLDEESEKIRIGD